MKDNKIISSIKTAGVVVTAAFTMASCGNKLSEEQTQIVKHKTDSAAVENVEYRMASNLFEVCDSQIKRYHQGNKDIVKMYAKDYIKSNISDIALQRFMLKALDDESLMFASNTDIDSMDGVSNNDLGTIRYIRKSQRWFNDLILFLTDKYDEKQFLKSDFFKVVNDLYLKRAFENNVSYMEELQSGEKFALERKNVIYNQLWNQYSKQVKRKR